jgi:hypothetical protein
VIGSFPEKSTTALTNKTVVARFVGHLVLDITTIFIEFCS